MRIATNLLSGLLAAILILLVTLFAARQVARSAFFLQGQFVTEVFAQDSMSLAGVLTEPRKLDATMKFLGAVTAAYINFEMIPVNEARTFAVIFESLGDDVSIDNFTYQGKMLVIAGEAPDASSFEEFRDALEEKDYFRSVGVHRYTTVEDSVRFEMECGL